MKVLITGAGGRLGRELVGAFEGHETVALGRADLDISDEAAVATAVGDLAPALVVNAAAFTDVDACEDDPVRAHRVNALGPWWLARACARSEATFVHVSTDAVFGGPAPTDGHGHRRALTEFDPPTPVNVYSRSKVAGEDLVRSATPRHHVVRVAWVLDRDGTDFAGAILRRARSHGRVEVIRDQVGSPSYVADLAPAIREVAVSGRYGTVHRTNTGAVSRVELAREVFAVAGVDAEVVPVDARTRGDRAPRPTWSPLDPTHAELAGFRRLPGWRDAVARALTERGDAATGS
jgi:dTDP-4-dehydrorhamnose reductase